MPEKRLGITASHESRSRSVSPVKKIRRLQPDQSENDESNIKVSVRVRPLSSIELQNRSERLILMRDQVTQINPPSERELPRHRRSTVSGSSSAVAKAYKYDNSIWSCDFKDKNFVDQQGTYELVGKEYLKHALDGYNTCIFAYGQTGSGKSYTMMGNGDELGLIPRICKDLFKYTDKLIKESQIGVTIKVSYFEIYNEEVYDLLSNNDDPKETTKNRYSSLTNKEGSKLQKLKVRESPEIGPYVEGLNEFSVKNFQEVSKYLTKGNNNRKTASTRMNLSSSRSHAIFSVFIKQIEYSDILSDTILNIKHSTLRLIDLAGSERSSATSGMNDRLKEGNNINKSLTCLGRVMTTLAEKNSSRASSATNKVVPYRDSTLTWILKDSLGGNSKTAMIACISPCDYDESLSTLRYANNAKKIRNDAKINRNKSINNDNMKHQMEDLQSTIKKLENELSKRSSIDSFNSTKLKNGNNNEAFVKSLQQKISNNYKSYLEYYDEKLNEEQGKNQILISEINKLRAENTRLNLNLNSIIGTFMKEFEENDGSENKLVDIKRSNGFNSLAPILSPTKVRVTQRSSPNKNLEKLPNFIQKNSDYSSTAPSSNDENVEQFQRDRLLSTSKLLSNQDKSIDKPKAKKLQDLIRDFEDLQGFFKSSNDKIQNDLKLFDPKNRIVTNDEA